MRRRLPIAALAAAALAALLAPGCGPGSPGGPTINNRLGDENQTPPPVIQSNDILARDAVTNHAQVKHILIGWKGIGRPGGADARAEARTRQQADDLAVSLLKRVRAGEPIEPLMSEFSEDSGSADDGTAYDVTPGANLVFEFKRLGLRLHVGEAGLVLSQFGWHIMKRVE